MKEVLITIAVLATLFTCVPGCRSDMPRGNWNRDALNIAVPKEVLQCEKRLGPKIKEVFKRVVRWKYPRAKLVAWRCSRNDSGQVRLVLEVEDQGEEFVVVADPRSKKTLRTIRDQVVKDRFGAKSWITTGSSFGAGAGSDSGCLGCGSGYAEGTGVGSSRRSGTRLAVGLPRRRTDWIKLLKVAVLLYPTMTSSGGGGSPTMLVRDGVRMDGMTGSVSRAVNLFEHALGLFMETATRYINSRILLEGRRRIRSVRFEIYKSCPGGSNAYAYIGALSRIRIGGCLDMVAHEANSLRVLLHEAAHAWALGISWNIHSRIPQRLPTGGDPGAVHEALADTLAVLLSSDGVTGPANWALVDPSTGNVLRDPKRPYLVHLDVKDKSGRSVDTLLKQGAYHIVSTTISNALLRITQRSSDSRSSDGQRLDSLRSRRALTKALFNVMGKSFGPKPAHTSHCLFRSLARSGVLKPGEVKRAACAVGLPRGDAKCRLKPQRHTAALGLIPMRQARPNGAFAVCPVGLGTTPANPNPTTPPKSSGRKLKPHETTFALKATKLEPYVRLGDRLEIAKLNKYGQTLYRYVTKVLARGNHTRRQLYLVCQGFSDRTYGTPRVTHNKVSYARACWTCNYIRRQLLLHALKNVVILPRIKMVRVGWGANGGGTGRIHRKAIITVSDNGKSIYNILIAAGCKHMINGVKINGKSRCVYSVK